MTHPLPTEPNEKPRLDTHTDAGAPQPAAEPDDHALESIGRAITQPMRDASEPDEARQTPTERAGR